MGLDQYAFTTAVAPARIVDFPESETEQLEELHYWRKHPNLHGWMEALYVRKGGRNRDFNMSPVVLDGADLDQLEGDVREGRLPPTSGFFFGQSDDSERDDDLDFIGKARTAITSGRTVFYLASW